MYSTPLFLMYSYSPVKKFNLFGLLEKRLPAKIMSIGCTAWSLCTENNYMACVDVYPTTSVSLCHSGSNMHAPEDQIRSIKSMSISIYMSVEKYSIEKANWHSLSKECVIMFKVVLTIWSPEMDHFGHLSLYDAGWWWFPDVLNCLDVEAYC